MSIEERVEVNEKDVAVLKNEQRNLKETMLKYGENMDNAVSRIEAAIEIKCTQDNDRFKTIENQIREQSRSLHPIAIVIITVLVGLIGVLGGIVGAMLIGS